MKRKGLVSALILVCCILCGCGKVAERPKDDRGSGKDDAGGTISGDLIVSDSGNNQENNSLGGGDNTAQNDSLYKDKVIGINAIAENEDYSSIYNAIIKNCPSVIDLTNSNFTFSTELELSGELDKYQIIFEFDEAIEDANIIKNNSNGTIELKQPGEDILVFCRAVVLDTEGKELFTVHRRTVVLGKYKRFSAIDAEYNKQLNALAVSNVEQVKNHNVSSFEVSTDLRSSYSVTESMKIDRDNRIVEILIDTTSGERQHMLIRKEKVGYHAYVLFDIDKCGYHENVPKHEAEDLFDSFDTNLDDVIINLDDFKSDSAYMFYDGYYYSLLSEVEGVLIETKVAYGDGFLYMESSINGENGLKVHLKIDFNPAVFSDINDYSMNPPNSIEEVTGVTGVGDKFVIPPIGKNSLHYYLKYYLEPGQYSFKPSGNASINGHFHLFENMMVYDEQFKKVNSRLLGEKKGDFCNEHYATFTIQEAGYYYIDLTGFWEDKALLFSLERDPVTTWYDIYNPKDFHNPSGIIENSSDYELYEYKTDKDVILLVENTGDCDIKLLWGTPSTGYLLEREFLASGTKRCIKLKSEYPLLAITGDGGNYSLKVSEVEKLDNGFTLTEEYSEQIFMGYDEGDRTLTFTPAKDGEYSFDFDVVCGLKGPVNIEIYKGDSLVGEYINDSSFHLQKGIKYKVVFYYYNNTHTYFYGKVKVGKIEKTE